MKISATETFKSLAHSFTVLVDAFVYATVFLIY